MTTRTGRPRDWASSLGVATAICYSAYLLIIRRGGRDPRRPAGPVVVATVVVAVCAFVAGEGIGDLDLAPPLHSLFWLAMLGITAQSAGYLLISISLPRLPAIVTSIILLTQPVMSMVLAVVLLGETPSATQLVGVAMVIGGIAAATVPVARIRDGLAASRGGGRRAAPPPSRRRPGPRSSPPPPPPRRQGPLPAPAATRVADRIRTAISALRIQAAAGAAMIPLTISGGVAFTVEANDQWEAVLAAADWALYEAKAGGRDRVCVSGGRDGGEAPTRPHDRRRNTRPSTEPPASTDPADERAAAVA